MVSVSRTRVTDCLAADHARMHELLAGATAGASFDRRAFAAFRASLLRHIAIEEKLLFPAVRRATASGSLAWAHEIRIEHAALTSLMVPTPDAALCAEIVWLLDRHDAKEERPDGIYAACELLLSQAESEALASSAASFPAIRSARHSTVRTSIERPHRRSPPRAGSSARNSVPASSAIRAAARGERFGA